MSGPREPAARFSRPEWLLAFLLASHALITQWQFAGQQACIDYYQFWVVGRAAAAGEMRAIYSDAERKRVGEMYFQRALAEARALAPNKEKPPPTLHLQAAAQRQVLETYSTPWLYTVIGAGSLTNYEASQTLFQRVSFVLYLAAILALARLFGASPLALALWFVALLSWFNPYVDDVLVGNVNRFQLALIVAFLWIVVRKKTAAAHAMAGVLLGATLAFKPNLAAAAVAPFLGWAAAREFKKLIAVGAGLVAGVAASVLAAGAYFGSLEPWRAWLAEIPRLTAPGAHAAGSARDGNFSLARLLQDLTGVPVGPGLAVVLFAAIAFALFVERGRRKRADAPATESVRTVRLVGLGAALSLLAAEPSWQHYYVAVVPLAMVLLRPAEVDGGALPLLRVLAVVGVACVSLQNVGRLLELQDPRAAAAVMSAGTLLLFVVGLVDLARPCAVGAHPVRAPAAV